MEDDLRTLPDALSVIRRRWLTVLAFVVLGVLAGVGLSLLQAPQYTATTSVLVSSPVSQTAGSRALDPEEVATQAEIMVSDEVTSRVIEELRTEAGLDTDAEDLLARVVAEPLPDSQVIEVSATASESGDAADIANAFATSFIDVGQQRIEQSQQRVIDYYVDQSTETRDRLEELRDELATAGDSEALAIQGQIDGLTARQTQLQTTLIGASDPSQLVPRAQILKRATDPQSPSQPDAVRSGILGGVIGLVLGLLVAFVRERMDDVVRDAAAAETLLGAPVLGHIPRFDSDPHGRVLSLVSPFSAVAEACRVLNANVRFLLAAHTHEGGVRRGARLTPSGSVMVASAAPAEGKSSLAANLAVTAARSGTRVVLVDADLRSPSIAGLFGLDAQSGLSDLLIDVGDTADYLLDSGVDNLVLLPAGSIPPNPAELLASPQANALWTELRSMADLVIIDTPPLLRVADGLEVAAHVDAVVVVARYGATRNRDLEAVSRRLTQIAGERSVGVVVNAEPGSKEEHAYGYGYGQRPTVGV
jgi:capsular exopolysaccharide synthesis family protein